MRGKTASAVLALLLHHLLLTAAQADTRAPLTGRVEVRGRTVEVEVAASREEIVKGLSGHPPLPDGRGMLFLFPSPIQATFWMKDMLFDLDIVWIRGGKVVHIDHLCPAEGHAPARTYSPGSPVDDVLEIPAGMARRWGMEVGDDAVVRLDVQPAGKGAPAPP